MHPSPSACNPAHYTDKPRVNPAHPRRSHAATSEEIRTLKFLSDLLNCATYKEHLNLTAEGVGERSEAAFVVVDGVVDEVVEALHLGYGGAQALGEAGGGEVIVGHRH